MKLKVVIFLALILDLNKGLSLCSNDHSETRASSIFDKYNEEILSEKHHSRIVPSCACYLMGVGAITGGIFAGVYKLGASQIAGVVLGSAAAGILIGLGGSGFALYKFYRYKEKNNIFHQIRQLDFEAFQKILKKKPNICNEAVNGYTPFDFILEQIYEAENLAGIDDENRQLVKFEEFFFEADLTCKTIDNALAMRKLRPTRDWYNGDLNLLNKIREKKLKKVVNDKLKMLPNAIILIILDYDLDPKFEEIAPEILVV